MTANGAVRTNGTNNNEQDSITREAMPVDDS